MPFPYGLVPRDFFRTVEDLHDLLHDLNSLLHDRHYQRLEELLDPAGFSGLLSRTVVTRLAQASRSLAVNRYHNGYPDLIVKGRYPHDAVAHGDGGLEIKASRYDSGWQTHGPRAGWFAVVQFELDAREDIAVYDREPTRVLAVLVAEVAAEDWLWQPAGAGRIRSGTATIRASGAAKLRAGAVWVAPDYRARHDELAERARISSFGDAVVQLVLDELDRRGGRATANELTKALAPASGIPEQAVRSRVTAALRRLTRDGNVRAVEPRGAFVLSPSQAGAEAP